MGDFLVAIENDGDTDTGIRLLLLKLKLMKTIFTSYEIEADGDVILIEENGDERDEEVDSIGTS